MLTQPRARPGERSGPGAIGAARADVLAHAAPAVAAADAERDGIVGGLAYYGRDRSPRVL